MKLTKSELRQIIQEELEASLDEKWEASKMRMPKISAPSHADDLATAAAIARPVDPRMPKISAPSHADDLATAAAFKPEKEPPVATTPWRTEEDKAALDMPPDTGDDEETNESQDKLYQMVQEELEAVLDEAGGTWDPVQAKEKRERRSTPSHGAPYGAPTWTTKKATPTGTGGPPELEPVITKSTDTRGLEDFGDFGPATTFYRDGSERLPDSRAGGPSPLGQKPEISPTELDRIAKAPGAAPAPDEQERAIKQANTAVSMTRRRQEGLIKQMVQETLQAVIAERNR